MIMKRLFIVFLVIIGLCLLGVFRRVRNEIIYRLPFAVPGMPPCPDCNVVLVNLDTMRAPELGCYGYVRDTTPRLCQFAKEHILFSRFYTQSSITLDSHMSIFTGLLPTTHHVIDALKDSLNPDIPTLTQMFARAGYDTVWGGLANDILLPLDKGLGRGFSEVHDINGADPNEYTKLLPKLLDDKPTFMFLHSYSPHSPYLPGPGPRTYGEAPPGTTIPVTEDEFSKRPEQFFRFMLADVKERLQMSQTSESKERNQAVIHSLSQALSSRDMKKADEVFLSLPAYEQYDLSITWYWKNIDKNDPNVVSYIQGLYDEVLGQTDSDVSQMLAFFSKPEVKRKTIVIFFSDNGEEMMERGYFDHGWNIYNTETHAPFIMSAPRVKNGIYDELTQAIDIFPTLLDLVGIAPIAPLEGKSLRPILEGKGPIDPGGTYVVGQHRGDAIVSIRNDRWKMYKNNMPDKHYVELYDLLTDPEERHNILGEHLDTARLLDDALTRLLRASPRYASVSAQFPDWIDEKKRNELIKEGYF